MKRFQLRFRRRPRNAFAPDLPFASPVTISNRKVGPCLPSLLWLLVFAAAGCQNASDMVGLSGVVTLDDKRLKDGVIAFYPEEAGSSSASPAGVEARIVEGAYRVVVPKGALIVSIEASVPNGAARALPDDYPGARSALADGQVVPAKYNVNSELRYTADEPHSAVDFRLATR